METLSNLYNHPPLLHRAVQGLQSEYSRGGSWKSVTQLVNNDPRLERYLATQPGHCAQDLDEALAAWRGTITHDAIERYARDDKEIVEVRLHAELAGKHISGKLDQLELHDPAYNTSVLRDWKQSTAKALIFGQKERFGVKGTHARQLHSLYWLIIANQNRNHEPWGFEGELSERTPIVVPIPGILEVFYILTDRSPWKSRTIADYPDTSGVRKVVPTISFEDAEEYLVGRIKEHEYYDEAQPEDCPPCSEEHRWTVPSKWALRVPGRQAAVKVGETKDEVLEWLESPKGEKYRGRQPYFEERKGLDVRCADWCPARNLCPLGRKAQEERSA